jgi:hypothetical protein
VNNELFWGDDVTDMLLDYLRGPGIFESHEMRRLSELPMGLERAAKSKNEQK